LSGRRVVQVQHGRPAAGGDGTQECGLPDSARTFEQNDGVVDHPLESFGKHSSLDDPVQRRGHLVTVAEVGDFEEVGSGISSIMSPECRGGSSTQSYESREHPAIPRSSAGHTLVTEIPETLGLQRFAPVTAFRQHDL
jgi:hypothetical protein